MAMYINPVDDQEQRDERAIAAVALEERRRAERIKRKFVTQMTPWTPGVPSVPFEVVIEDISDTGVGLVHDVPLSLGVPHLLTVPRGDEGGSIMREYVVVRCNIRTDGKYAVGLEVSSARSGGDKHPKKSIVGSNVKLLFLALGIVGLLAATFIPLD
jgi:hypothetical protein